MLAAVKQNVDAIMHAAPEHKADREVVIEAVKQQRKCIQACGAKAQV